MDFELKYNTYALSSIVEVQGEPDGSTSPGAKFLERIQDDANEIIADCETFSEFKRILESDPNGVIHELADGAVPIYTSERWKVFAELCLYHENISEFGEVDGDDLTNSVAGVACYIVAERGIRTLLQEVADDNKAELRGLPPIGTKGKYVEITEDFAGEVTRYDAEVTDHDEDDERLPIHLHIYFPPEDNTAGREEDKWVELDEFEAETVVAAAVAGGDSDT